MNPMRKLSRSPAIAGGCGAHHRLHQRRDRDRLRTAAYGRATHRQGGENVRQLQDELEARLTIESFADVPDLSRPSRADARERIDQRAVAPVIRDWEDDGRPRRPAKGKAAKGASETAEGFGLSKGKRACLR